jgi:uncharacterized membrane protein YgcG
MHRQMKILLTLILLTLGGLFISCDKKINQKTFKLEVQNRIFDHADLLTMQQEDSLFQLIQSLDNEIGSQIAVVTVSSLDGQRIEEYSLDMAERLGLGREKFDDGILITVAAADRKMRIEVGYGLEKIVKDEIASRLNREEMAPSFSENDYAGGLSKAIKKIIKLIKENKELVGQRP